LEKVREFEGKGENGTFEEWKLWAH